MLSLNVHIQAYQTSELNHATYPTYERQHWQDNHHEECGLLLCGICDVVFVNSIDLARHVGNTHPQVPVFSQNLPPQMLPDSVPDLIPQIDGNFSLLSETGDSIADEDPAIVSIERGECPHTTIYKLVNYVLIMSGDSSVTWSVDLRIPASMYGLPNRLSLSWKVLCGLNSPGKISACPRSQSITRES